MKWRNGFSMVEVLLVVGLMGGLAAAFMQLNKSMVTSSSTAESDFEVQQLLHEITLVLSRSENCYKTFGEPKLDARNGTVDALKYNTPSGFVDKLSTSNLLPNLLHYKKIKILSYKLNGNAPDVDIAANTTSLDVTFDKGPLTNVPIVNKRIKLYVKTNANIIESCFAIGRGESTIWSRTLADPNNIYYRDGLVGIGTTDPKALLHVTNNNDVPGATSSKILIEGNEAKSDGINRSVLALKENAVGIQWNMHVLGIATPPDTHAYQSGSFIINRAIGYKGLPNATGIVMSPDMKVGIGEPSPQAKLSVYNPGPGAELRLSTTPNLVSAVRFGHDDYDTWALGPDFSTDNHNFFIGTLNGSMETTHLMIDRNTGNVGIGSVAVPSQKLVVAGIGLGNEWQVTSDLRLKKDIEALENPLKKILNLQGIYFKWKKDQHSQNASPSRHIGLIAQNVEKQFPELVLTDNNGMKSVNYAAMVAPLIEAVKILKQENDELKISVEKLNSRLQSIENSSPRK